MKYFETHAHPDHPLVEKPDEYMQTMVAAGIDKIVVAPITNESNYTSLEMFPKEEYPQVFFAKGLHPKCALNEALWNKKQIAQFEELLDSPRVVAVKTGLDFCKKKVQENQINRQYEFLKLFMDLAYKHQKPLVLHIREAAEEAIQFFTENTLMVPAAIHCFVYDVETMHKFIDAGVRFFGIGGMVTRSENEKLQEAVKAMPPEMILLESDAPFVKVEGDTEAINTSAKAIPIAAKKIAELKGISVEEVAEATYQNACRFLGMREEK